MQHTFKIPIGDWSGDGHMDCVWYTVKSNKDVQAMREALFSVEKMHPGFLEFFTQYDQGSLKPEEYESLIAVLPEFADEFEEYDPGTYDTPYSLKNGTESYFKLLVAFAKLGDDELEIENIEMPMLPFYGYDEQKRHLSYGGYGLLGP